MREKSEMTILIEGLMAFQPEMKSEPDDFDYQEGWPLTPKMIELLDYTVLGMDYGDIAREKGGKVQTVKNQAAAVLRRTGKKSMTAAVLWYVDAKIQIRTQGAANLDMLLNG